MTLRGPDYMPYPMPTRLPPRMAAPPPIDTRSRREIALANLTQWGVVAVGAGAAALLSLLLVSLLTGHRATGAAFASVAAAVAVVAGVRALKRVMPPDSAHLIKSGQGTAIMSALMAVLLLLLIRPADAQPPVQAPRAVPTFSQEQTPTPAPQESWTPGFGVPTLPDPPLTEGSTDKGTLTGVVLDSTGKPVPGATVLIERSIDGDTSDAPECPLATTVRTNAKGIYTASLCQLGPDLGYQTTITARGAVTTAQMFVHAGRTTRFDVILTR